MITRRLDVDPEERGVTEPIKPDAEPHPQLPPPTKLELHVVSTGEVIVVSLQNAVVIGRKDPAHRIQPDIDLTPYRGYQCGVSRSHAVLFTREGAVWMRALSSTNGTFVNNMPLAAGTEHRIRDGDELRLGALRLRLAAAAPGGA